MNFRPLHDNILVERLEEGESMIGGIIIPDSAKEKPQQAKVLSTGPGKMLKDGKRAPVDIKAGDRILFGKYSGSEVKVGGTECLILKESEVLAVLE
jgi:chaperonin GroES